MLNRLANETSPYLLQHQDNPVDWYPWGEEAFARAKAEDKPVFLSVGYSSCHWCHVMAHESFEDEAVAALLNEHFIAVKVDREERPDVDEAYMAAVQLTSGRGGWPMSVFMTPDRKPFFAGTYFPKEDRGGHPGILSVLRQLIAVWQSRRADLLAAAQEIEKALEEHFATPAPATEAQPTAEFVNLATEQILADLDPQFGGFGKAPKFPPHSAIELLLLTVMRESSPPELRVKALSAAALTLREMALGGIHDHVGGGFHRYSTDAEWVLPHFEKMLYDNALMLGNYARAAALIGEIDASLGRLFAQTAVGVVRFLQSELMAPEGYFYSALDADSEGEEGRFYTWTEAEVTTLLGQRTTAFCEAYSFRPEGNFRDEATGQVNGRNILYRAGGNEEFDADLEELYERRAQRTRPGLDDKALVGWNGIAIGSLAEAGAIEVAERAARAILAAEQAFGQLPHQISQGKPSGNAFLEDYANFIYGLLKLTILLTEVAGPGHAQSAQFFLLECRRLSQEMVARFYDEEKGGFFATSESHEALFGRTKPTFDQPIPSANAIAIRVLLMTGDQPRTVKSLRGLMGWMERAPQATEALLATLLLTLPEMEESDAQDVVIETPPSVPAASVATPPKPVEKVKVRLKSSEVMANKEGKAQLVLEIVVPEGLHVNSDQPPARWLVPTKAVVRPLKATVTYPVATADRFEGTFEILLDVVLPSGQPAAEFEVVVTFQACTDQECHLAEERLIGGVVIRP